VDFSSKGGCHAEPNADMFDTNPTDVSDACAAPPVNWVKSITIQYWPRVRVFEIVVQFNGISLADEIESIKLDMLPAPVIAAVVDEPPIPTLTVAFRSVAFADVAFVNPRLPENDVTLDIVEPVNV
jgi:hypothetical protein